jgi:hypothetical protein
MPPQGVVIVVLAARMGLREDPARMEEVAVWKTIEVVRDPDVDLRTHPHAKQPNDIVEGQFIRHRGNVPTSP